MGLFRKGETGIIAKFHETDLDIWSHSREGKTPSYSQINTVITKYFLVLQMELPLYFAALSSGCIEEYLLQKAIPVTPVPVDQLFYRVNRI